MGEEGLAGWLITVTGLGSSAKLTTTVTDSNGRYRIQVPANYSYRVRLAQSLPIGQTRPPSPTPAIAGYYYVTIRGDGSTEQILRNGSAADPTLDTDFGVAVPPDLQPALTEVPRVESEAAVAMKYRVDPLEPGGTFQLGDTWSEQVWLTDGGNERTTVVPVVVHGHRQSESRAAAIAWQPPGQFYAAEDWDQRAQQ